MNDRILVIVCVLVIAHAESGRSVSPDSTPSRIDDEAARADPRPDFSFADLRVVDAARQPV